jgi:hypothetical protein
MAQKLIILGIDIAKRGLYVVGMDDTGAVVLRKRIGVPGASRSVYNPNTPELDFIHLMSAQRQ